MRGMGALGEWDALAPLAAGVALVLWAIWPDQAQPSAPRGDDLLNVLEDTATGQAVPWSDPASGAHGTLVPSAVFRATSGEWCRAYRISFANGDGQISGHVACRLVHGGWRDQPAVSADRGEPRGRSPQASARAEQVVATHP